MSLPEDPSLAELRAQLRQRGVRQDEIDRADDDGTLELLAIDRLIATEPSTVTLNEMAERGTVDMELRARLWRAIGMPDADPDAPIFSEADVAMAQLVQELVGNDTDEELRLLQISRVLGSSMARIAEAQVGAVEAGRNRRDQLIEAGLDDPGPAIDTDALITGMPQVMDFVWRLHLRAAARRRMALLSSGITDELTIGFVDLVDFTRLAESMDDDELVSLVDRFEADTFDAVSAVGGRVVKTIGDAVMFSVRDTPVAAALALDLVDHYADSEVTDLRVGLATGPVVEKEGDLFGPTVNFASRLTGVAYPAAVVVSEVTAKELEIDGHFALSKLPAQDLKGLGRRVSFRVRRAGDEVPAGENELMRRRDRRARRLSWVWPDLPD